MTKYMGYELHHCKPFAGKIEHGINGRSSPQVACFYWQIRCEGKLIDTALTIEVAQSRVRQQWLTAKVA